MTKKQKIIVGGLTLISVFAAFAYIQIKKSMNYAYRFSRFKANTVNLNKINFDLYFFLKNPSKITYTIKSITTDVYIDKILLTKIVNFNPQKILPNAETEIGVNVNLNTLELLEKLKLNWSDLILNWEKLDQYMVTMDMKFKIGYRGIFTITVPYTEKFKLSSLKPTKK